jgi:2-polyprenyl-3-methyl-5-hydroxy-6-metoxy-1,4-benzoquinol methylase
MYQNIDDPWGQVGNANSLKHELLLAMVRHIASGSPINRTLDVGCGLGALTSRLRAALGENTRLWACDVSETAIPGPPPNTRASISLSTTCAGRNPFPSLTVPST